MSSRGKFHNQNVQDILSLTPLQEGMLFHYLKNPDAEYYFEQLTLKLSGTVNLDLIKQVWGVVVANNEMLRTVFKWEKLQRPVQVVLKQVEVPIYPHDLTHCSEEERDLRVHALISEDQQKKIDIEVEPFRVTVIRLSERDSVMVISNHHIIYDGWSTGIILKEFLKTYNRLLAGELPTLVRKTSYKDFIKWQQKQNQQEYQQYWKAYLEGFESKTPLPGVVERELEEVGAKVSQHTFSFDAELTRQINQFVKGEKITIATLIYSAWGILLQRYNLTDDIVFGTTVSGRNCNLPGVEEMVGLFINTIPLRVQTDGNETVQNLLQRLNQSINARTRYESTSLVEIKSWSAIDPTESVFDSIVVIENYPLDQQLNAESKGLHVDSYEMRESTNFDLTLAVEMKDCISAQLGYSTAKYTAAAIQRIERHFRNILTALVANPEVRVVEVEMLSASEREELLVEWNSGELAYPEGNVCDLIEHWALQTPDAIAVTYTDQEITYAELNQKANQLARMLKTAGLAENQPVGIMADRSLELIIGILGILKAGGAYLPINPGYPEERVRYMLEDSGAEILLTHQHLQGKVQIAGQVFVLEEPKIYCGDGSNLPRVGGEQELAYLIYTSGSTGRPKGVMVSHQALMNFLFNMYDNFNGKMGLGDRGLSLTNISFDVSVCEIFLPLAFGATLVLFNNELVPDIHKLARSIVEEKITFAYIPPTILREVYDLLRGEQVELNKMLVGVEPIKDYILEDYLSLHRDMQIVNGYGPTEATICATFYQYKNVLPVGRNVPIGKPLANTQIYLLDQHLNLVPWGAVGELCIAGRGLAQGYLNQQELTAAKFVTNPFNPGEKMYRTGDLARLLPDGNIEFVGRIDQQVKIRGFRIEPGEIENVLANYGPIKEVTVVPRTDHNGQKYLSAYLVASSQVTVGELREYLAQNLPEYMIPTYFIQLEKLPLTMNGKIDRKALPLPEGNITTRTEYAAPTNETEEALVRIWREVLHLEQVGINDNFFELGGHSLKATILVGKMHKELNVEVPLNEIFRQPTVRGIGEYIRQSQKTVYEAIGRVAEQEYYEASSAQKRMYMLQELDRENTSYNISGVFEVEGSFDVKRAEKAIQTLLKRHETLRTSFGMEADKIVQRVQQNVKFAVEMSDGREGRVEDVVAGFIRPFDLNKAPLFRVGLVQVDVQKYILLFDMHHIISDGTSMGVLVKEFTDLYAGKNLSELRIQYKDYAEWQNKLMQSEWMKKQETYWLGQFSEEVPVLNWMTDYPRPTVQSFVGDRVRLNLGSELTVKLHEVAKAQGSTLYMVLLSGLNILLAKYSGQEDIVIGSPIAGRPHPDLEKMIGMFINSLALRNRPATMKTYATFLQEVRENAVQAFEHQDFQFEELVERLNVKRDFSRNPLFDVFFVMQNMEGGELKLDQVSFTPYEFAQRTVKFDLTVLAEEVGQEINLNLDYSVSLFKRETIERMAQHLRKIFEEISKNPDVILGEIDMLSATEKAQVLYGWNETEANFPKGVTLQAIFEEQVAKRPQQIALIAEGHTMTYDELNARANRLAWSLRERGVTRDSIVGMVVKRSMEMMVGILAILKAGGAYLPIAPEYPAERIEYILEDSRAVLVLTQTEYSQKITGREVIDLLVEESYSTGEKVSENLPNVNESRDLAYVIYTSGSTGKPKGVVIEHRSLINTIHHLQTCYPLDETDLVLQSTVYTFDASVRELFWWYYNGSQLCLLPHDGEKDPKLIVETIASRGVTMAKFVPVLLNEVLNVIKELGREKTASLKYLLVGGEALSRELVRKYFKIYGQDRESRPEFVNVYGPSEATIHCTEYRVKEPLELVYAPIGRPIANDQVYVLDQNRKPTAIGVTGELYIAGVGLAREYLNNASLTAERFVANPFLVGERMYRTGDLARWLPDGNVEFLGRIDHQVKIRGYRIELGEIESLILQYSVMTEAVVLDRVDQSGNKFLCGYFVAREVVDIKALREFMGQSLPEYMIPTFFVQLEMMPLTTSGKIDRKALPEPEGNLAQENSYEPPRNAMEERLAAIWSGVLGVNRVGINDHFFEMGGHSLKAAVLVGKIHKELGVEIPLREIFNRPTIKGLSILLQSGTGKKYAGIEKVAEREHYETSSAQKRMYLLQQFDRENTSYNMPAVFAIAGEINSERLEKAFGELIQRHESLRTSFAPYGESVIQRIEPKVDFAIEYLSHTEGAQEEVIRDFIRPFDLSQAPLMRVGLLQVGEENLLLVDMHHIISDGASIEILVREFAELYAGGTLAEPTLQYKDFAEWQSKMHETEEMQKQETYWLNRFSDEVPVLELPTDFPRPVVKGLEGDRIRYEFSPELTRKLQQIVRETGSTMYMVLLSGLNILLAKYSRQEDIVVGSPIAGRPHADLEGIIGMFVNTLAMRNQPEGKKRYRDFLQEIKETAFSAYENQDYQFEELVERLNIRRDLSRNPLFDVMFTVQEMPLRELAVGDAIFHPVRYDSKTAKFDLTVNAMETAQGIHFNVEFSTELWERATVQRIMRHLEQICAVIADNPEIRLAEIDMLTTEEKEQIVRVFNDTTVDFPRDKTIQELFEEHAYLVPEARAVICGEQVLTYRELNERANGLAKILRENGVQADALVGIVAERSVEMIVGVLAILKAGGAYLPIDPHYPAERINLMLADCGVSVLLTQGEWRTEVDWDGRLLDLRAEKLYEKLEDNPSPLSTPENLAYVIYTSGSTGQPKGVMIEQRSVVRLVKSTDFVQFYPGDRILQTGTLAFDASTFEIWGALLNGLELHLGTEELILRPEQMEDYLISAEISSIFLTTSLFNMLADHRPEMFRKLKYLLTGGEAVSPKHVNRVRRACPALQVVHVYGPTENTTFSTKFFVDREYVGTIPIGTPIHNSTGYVLDKYNNLCPIGVYGELCVGGVGLARGYLNKPELTAEKFVANPFMVSERMYRTGDLVRWLPDGNLEFFGRIDQQVKIRGFRIEPGEIESCLKGCDGVKEVIVLDRKDASGGKYLCAYLVADREIGVGEIREYLGQNLPEYMIPAYFVQLAKMPLNRNGKIDRKALPEPEVAGVTGVLYVAPQTVVEEKVVAIWKEVLGFERIGINDNFFELGGHSLKATVLASKIEKALHVELPLREVFKHPTVKELAAYLEGAATSEYAAIQPVKEREYYPASSAQKRMYLLQQFELTSTNYNIPAVFLLEGELELEKLYKALSSLIARHETLRTSFGTIDEEIIQRVEKNVPFIVESLQPSRTGIEAVALEFIRPFDLSKAPLFRVGLMPLEEKKYLLLFDIHHIISDGSSMAVLVNEIAQLYAGRELPPLRIQYKDYADWQNLRLQSEEMQKQEYYWLNRFGDEIPVLNLPTDFPRPAIQNLEGARLGIILEPETSAKLKVLAQKTGTTTYMILLSAINILLAKYSGQEDIIVGSPIAGRPHADLENIIGMFINTLAMRSQPCGDKSYYDFLQEVRETALRAFENQEYPFEKLVDLLHLRRDLSRNPLFDVSFVMQNMEQEELHLGQIKFTPYEYENKTAKFDLTIVANEVEEGISLQLEYCTRLFRRETAEQMLVHLRNIISTVVTEPTLTLGEIDMLTPEEKSTILCEFNATLPQELPERYMCVHELIAAQAAKTPDAVAVSFRDRNLTYRQLEEKADRLALILEGLGVGPERLVGIMVERSFEMIVGILGIMKAGGAYLPIDPDYPADRIGFILKDSRVPILLTQSQLVERIPGDYTGNVIPLDEIETQNKAVSWEDRMTNSYQEIAAAAGDSVRALQKAISGEKPNPKNLAYVIYTSGSTGKPKGVMIEHRNIVNTLLWRKDLYEYVPGDKVLQIPSFAFDSSVEDILTTLIAGIELVLVDSAHAKDVIKLTGLIKRHRITHFLAVPSLYQAMMYHQGEERMSSLKLLTLAGEKLTEKTLSLHAKWQGHARIINEYGPTENAVCSTWYELPRPFEPDKEIPIGRPITNTRVYILDRYRKTVPIGVPGEMYLAGPGLARGYLNRPELTEERFVANPFGENGELMYRTGDLAKYRPDGNIEFLGRVDHQVKIRGFRIEPGEIESVLLQYPPVKEAVVLDRVDDDGQMYLAGYLVFEDGAVEAEEEVRSYLSQRLPEYMVPQVIVTLADMPRTPNGKADRSALLTMEISLHSRNYVEPQNELEWKIAEIWAEVLGMEKVGRTDHFFEMGGHSLKATQVASRLYKLLGVEIPLRMLFEYPTIAGLASQLSMTVEKAYTPIPVQPVQKYYPLSHAQKRLWVLDQLEPGNIAYNVPMALSLHGSVELSALNAALQLVVERHESLRTRFVTVDDLPMQLVEDELQVTIAYEEWLDDADLQARILEEGRIPFDLTQSGLFRAKLVKLATEKYLFLLTMHHIISDGWSANILIKEMIQFYNAQRTGDTPRVELLPIQYRDYAVWQNTRLAKGQVEGLESYWLNQLNGELPVLELPTDRIRPAVQTFTGAVVRTEINRELSSKLQELAQKEDVTMYMLMLSAYMTLLNRYTGQNDLIVGTPIAGRPHPDLSGLIGFFVNTLAIRGQIGEEMNFSDLLRAVKGNVLEAFEHQEYPFDLLVEKLELERDLSRPPLFSTVFALQQFEDTLTHSTLAGLTVKSIDQHTGISKFDLSLIMGEKDDQFICSFEYNTNLFEQATILRLQHHFQTLLESIVESPKSNVHALQLVKPMEMEQYLATLKGEVELDRREKVLHELFEEQVQRTPELLAVRLGEKTLTYHQLNERADQLAAQLIAKGVTPDQLIGLMVERSLEMIIGILGILKAGGAYVPIDPDYPDERVSYVLEDAQVSLLLTQSKLRERVANYTGEIIFLDQPITLSMASNVRRKVKPNQLAYVIYTSGSTGKPKGVLVEHRGVVNSMLWRSSAQEYGPGKRMLQVLSFTFDGSLSEFCSTLLTGAELVLVENDQAKDVVALTEQIQRYRVTHLLMVPSLYRVSLEYWQARRMESLEFVGLGGEQITEAILTLHMKWQSHVRLFNEYGPTENSVLCTWHEVEHSLDTNRRIPIGQSLPNTRVYILDRQQQPVPPGVIGEIYLAGAGLARGYLNRPELTTERFLPDLFTAGERMYRTGDLGRLNNQGQLEFFGRLDEQVKVRGLRIELGEIENQLQLHPEVLEAVVAVQKDEHGYTYLIGYIVPKGETALESETESQANLLVKSIKQFLEERLPEYMVPTFFITLEQFPRTASGKINRKALPLWTGQVADSADYHQAPRNKVEMTLAEIWRQVLGVEQLGVFDNFFEIGGHSLKATQVISRIHNEMGQAVPLSAFFKTPTIAGLAELLNQATMTEEQLIPVQPVQSEYPLSHSQKRMWMIDQMAKSSAYNISTALILNGELNILAVEKAFAVVAERHESLRTRFGFSAGEAVQIIDTEAVDWFSHRQLEPGERIEEIVQVEAQIRFDLNAGRLWRVLLVELASDKHLLVLTMHHIIADGWSMGLLINEFSSAYNAEISGEQFSLPPLPIQYRDYAVWQNQMLANGGWKEQEEYWLNQFSEVLTPLELPKDQVLIENSHLAGVKTLHLDLELTKELQNLAQSVGVTMNMVVTTIFGLLLHKLSGSEDLVIGVPIAGRNHQQVEGLIGLFLNTLALRINFTGDPTCEELLERVKETSIGAFENQDYPYDKLVERLQQEHPERSSELFNVMLNYVTVAEDLEVKLDGIRLEKVEQGKIEAKFELEMYVQLAEDETGHDRLFFVLEYRKNLFSAMTINAMLGYLETIARNLVSAPETHISEVNIYGNDFQTFMDDFTTDTW